MKEGKINDIANGQFVSWMLPSEGGPTQAVVFVKFKPQCGTVCISLCNVEFTCCIWLLEKLIVSFTEYFLDHIHLTHLSQGTPVIDTGWGMKGLRAALQRSTW